MIVLDVLLVALAVGIVGAAVCARVVRQFERGVVYRLGRAQPQVRRPGPTMLVPFADRMKG